MNFEQLKSFVSVTKHKNYSKAARERYISQPAISSQMKSLEEELGTALFVRNQKNIILTEKGQQFYQHAVRMLAIEKDALNELKDDAGISYGYINIGAPWLTVNEQMDEFLVTMIREKRKEAICRILSREDTDIPKMVVNGELELGVCNHVIQNKNLAYEKAFTEEIVLITPNRERYHNLSPEGLRKLVLEEGHIRYDFGEGCDFLWNDFFGKVIGEDLHGIHTVATTCQYTQQLAAVEAGMGIGFVSSICMQKEWREGKILAYRCKGLLEKPHYVVYNKSRVETSEVIAYTKDLLVKELRESIDYPQESF